MRRLEKMRDSLWSRRVSIELGLADRRQHALRGGGVDAGILPAQIEVFLEGHFVFVAGRVSRLVSRSNLDHDTSLLKFWVFRK